MPGPLLPRRGRCTLHLLALSAFKSARNFVAPVPHSADASSFLLSQIRNKVIVAVGCAALCPRNPLVDWGAGYAQIWYTCDPFRSCYCRC